MFMSIVRVPPRPPGRFLSGHSKAFRQDRLGFLTRCAREYGDVVALRIGPMRVLLLVHPDHIEQALVTDNHNFRKHYGLRMNTLLLGNGLLTSDGAFWLRQRRLAQPAFQRQRIAGYAETMVAYTERLLAGWREGETRDLQTEMTRLTLEITGKTLFGADVGGEAPDVGRAMADAMDSFEKRVSRLFPLPYWVPTATNRRLLRAVRRLDEIIFRFIKERRACAEERDDLLSLLLHARDEDDGGQMTDQQLRDEAMTLFLAGHETTALALAWTGYLLAQHPGEEEKLRAELGAVLGGRAATAADLPRLAFTERVVLESMRLYPPAYAIGREALGDTEIGGYPVRKGTTLFLSQWVTHRDPRWFGEPERFHPDRWANGLAQRLPKFAYFPFGGGPRLCIGNTFALMEAVLVVATIFQQFRYELIPDHPVTPWPAMTLRPKHGIRVVLRRV
jgi:cytochrome P450